MEDGGKAAVSLHVTTYVTICANRQDVPGFPSPRRLVIRLREPAGQIAAERMLHRQSRACLIRERPPVRTVHEYIGRLRDPGEPIETFLILTIVKQRRAEKATAREPGRNPPQITRAAPAFQGIGRQGRRQGRPIRPRCRSAPAERRGSAGAVDPSPATSRNRASSFSAENARMTPAIEFQSVIAMAVSPSSAAPGDQLLRVGCPIRKASRRVRHRRSQEHPLDKSGRCLRRGAAVLRGSRSASIRAHPFAKRGHRTTIPG